MKELIGQRWKESTRIFNSSIDIEYECLGIGSMMVDGGEETSSRPELVGFYLPVEGTEIGQIRGIDAAQKSRCD